MWLGLSLSTWQKVLNWATFVFGLLAVVSSPISVTATVVFGIVAVICPFIGVKISDLVQRASMEKVANANVRAAEVSFEHEQLKREVGPRHLNREAFLKALTGDVTGEVEILYSRDDAEAMELAQQIALALEEASWKVLKREPIPNSNALLPSAMEVSGQPKGVTIAVPSITEQEWHAEQNQAFGKEWIKTPYTVLYYAMAQALGSVSGWVSGPNAPKAGTLRIIVASRI